MKPRIKIISDSDPINTQVLLDGEPIPHLSKIVVHAIEPNGEVEATITICPVALEISCKAANIENISAVRKLLEVCSDKESKG